LTQVLHVMASGARGGGGEHLLGLLPRLQGLGFACSAAIGADGPLRDELAAFGIRTVTLDLMRSRLSLRGAVAVAEMVRRTSPQIVHCHGTRAAFFAALGRRWWPETTRMVYTAHGLSTSKVMSPLRTLVYAAAEKKACRAADHVISVAREDLDQLRGRHWISVDRSSHIPNAVDTDRFSPRDRAKSKDALGIGGQEAVVGTVARLIRQKAVCDVITAAAGLPDVQFVIVGDGELRSELERQAAPLGTRVRFLGSRSDVELILPALDVFVLASHWEGEPIALLEAMSASLACIATATPGAIELFGRPAAGVLVPIGDPAALRHAIAALLGDPARRRLLGEAARATVMARGYETMAERVAEVYRGCLSAVR
jgi:glycosyltransferase involved in cell wall biosynthesis